MNKPKILRRRYIPFELVDISSDKLLFRNEELIATEWKAIRPREDIAGGVSWTFLKEGYKIGKFLDSSGRFLYWYCDIIEVEYDEALDQYTLLDLLLDIKVMPGGEVRVLDADELSEALEQKLITTQQACKALKKLDILLKMIYSGNFPPPECNVDDEGGKQEATGEQHGEID